MSVVVVVVVVVESAAQCVGPQGRTLEVTMQRDLTISNRVIV